jgi:serine phosphatase RsbU (regulator of sigma subunit)
MDTNKPIRVAVAADQDIFRRGLMSMVSSLRYARLIGEARNSDEARQMCQMLKPDILLLSVQNLPEERQELLQGIHKLHPEITLIFFLSSQEENLSQEELDAGEVIYFSKDLSEEEFTNALLEIHNHLRTVKLEAPAVQAAHHAAGSAGKTESFEQTRDRELQMAGKIQADIMPEQVPSIPGWDIAAVLESARETSGDFFDFIALPNQHWAIVIGDVTDKGIGAALFMALTSTLIRTYAIRYPTLPALTMDVVNQRMLTDSRGSMFVTAFFGILEPSLGRMRFVNAGHPPGLMVNARSAKPLDQLKPTGMALGIVEKTHWRQKVMKFSPGDTLLLYTDGITEAQNGRGEQYGEHRLVRTFRTSSGRPAAKLIDSILDDLRSFTGKSTQQDDIAIIAITRKH